MIDSMSRAVVATAYGGPDVLRIVDVDPGEPGPEQVLVEVRAAGINPADWKAYSGASGTDASRLPMRLGYEAAGTVLTAGPGVDGVAPGDDVLFQRSGAYAERLVVKAENVVRKPAALSWARAGGLLVVGSTAMHTVVATRVGSGDTVLVHGAAGGVGSMAVQLARVRGARVIGTASVANHEYLLDIGATPVAYGPGLADRVRALAPRGVDAAIDTVGTNEALDVSIALVKDRHRIATVAAFGRAPALRIQLLGHGPHADPGDDIRAAARPTLVDLVATGRIDVRIAGTYPLEQVARAHRVGLAGHVHGKLVLVR